MQGVIKVVGELEIIAWKGFWALKAVIEQLWSVIFPTALLLAVLHRHWTRAKNGRREFENWEKTDNFSLLSC